MIKYVVGDILNSPYGTIVIPVNCEGVMGAGLAKQFKDKFPETSKLYIDHSSNKGLKPGEIVRVNQGDCEKSVLFAATKDLWRNNSEAKWIDRICQRLIFNILRDEKVALTLLGCGLGCLSWERTIKPIYEKYLEPAKQEFIVYVRG